MPDFKSILSEQVDDAKPPVPLPTGTYLWVIKRHEFAEKGEKKTPAVDFYCVPTQALDDVDQDMLAQVDGWNQKEKNLGFWLTPDAKFILAGFLKDSLHISTDGRSFAEAIPETTNQMFKGTIVHKPNKNPDMPPYSNIESWAAADD